MATAAVPPAGELKAAGLAIFTSVRLMLTMPR